MSRRVSCLQSSWPLLALLAAAGCGTNATSERAASSEPPAPVTIATERAVEQPITRYVSVSGTLTAEEQAEVAAEIAGRVMVTPVERGTVVRAGSPLVRIAAEEAEAQAREAEANAAQIQARLGQSTGEGFEAERVPEVATARATSELARTEFERARALHEHMLISQAEFDQRRAQAENAQRQYESARNAAEQQRQALAAARARLTLAQKALADTVVRAPFDGVVAERLVSVGDYVTRGTKVASVMRVHPLRVQLTVPAQYIASMDVGRAVTLVVDAYPDRMFTGSVRYISPGVSADSRALVVEAVVPNETGMLKPGLFVTAQIEQASSTPAILVPSDAVRTVTGTSRVFVVVGDRVEERIVTTGQAVGPLVEVTTGLKAGDRIAVSNLAQLADATPIAVAP
jgi:multidrug efflux pump subunit AcrA (membrane-fusion protein)